MEPTPDLRDSRPPVGVAAIAAALLWCAVGCIELEFPDVDQDPHPPVGITEYEISIVVFGRSEGRPKRRYVHGAPKKQRVTVGWMYWLLEGGGKRIVVDPGFGEGAYVKRFDVEDHVRPDLPLEGIGLSAADVDHVLLSHYHGLRADAVRLYPGAMFHFQSPAYAHCLRWMRRKSAKRHNVDEGAIRFLGEAEERGRLRLVDGTYELLDGIKAHTHNIHTMFYSYFVVSTAEGPVVIAGDLAPFYENIEKNRAIGQTKSRALNRRIYANMRRIAGGKRKILPGNDLEVTKRFPRRADRVYRVTWKK